MHRTPCRRALAASALCVTSLGAQAAFDITVTYSGLTPTQQSFFDAAASFWESVITGYLPGISRTGFNIVASGANIDGVSGILGSAGPTSVTSQAGYFLTTAGEMEFDLADIDALITQGTFTDVIKHEMAHVIGFGTLWALNGVSSSGSGTYTGAAALAAYKVEFSQPGATSVPVELGGGPGTANGHWDEVDGGGGNTGRVDLSNRDMRFELMTGWLNAPTYVSETTIASFQDIGYLVVPSPVPEPGLWAMLLLGAPAVGVAAVRRRRQIA